MAGYDRFLDYLEKNPDLAREVTVKWTQDQEELLRRYDRVSKIAAEHGFAFTAEEMLRAEDAILEEIGVEELDDDELETVAGGVDREWYTWDVAHYGNSTYVGDIPPHGGMHGYQGWCYIGQQARTAQYPGEAKPCNANGIPALTASLRQLPPWSWFTVKGVNWNMWDSYYMLHVLGPLPKMPKNKKYHVLANGLDFGFKDPASGGLYGFSTF